MYSNHQGSGNGSAPFGQSSQGGLMNQFPDQHNLQQHQQQEQQQYPVYSQNYQGGQNQMPQSYQQQQQPSQVSWTQQPSYQTSTSFQPQMQQMQQQHVQSSYQPPSQPTQPPPPQLHPQNHPPPPHQGQYSHTSLSQPLYGTSHQFQPSAPPEDILNAFDPFAKPTPITVPKTDPGSVQHRLVQAKNRGILSAHEFDQILPQVSLLPTKITLALDQLENMNDKSGVFEILMNLQPPQQQMQQQQYSFSQQSMHTSHSMPQPVPTGWGGTTATASVHGSNAGWMPSQSSNVSVGQESDSDEDTGTIVDSDDERRQETDEEIARKLQEQFDAEAMQSSASFSCPHPCAGGFKGEMPSSFALTSGELLGKILVRVTSKKLFRKWKEMFFVVTKNKIALYDSSYEYESKRPARIVYRVHPCMYIRNPTVKQTFSIMDDGRRIFYTTFRENVQDEGGTGAYALPPSSKYSFDAKSQRICKFGATNLNEIRAFAHSVHSVIRLARYNNNKATGRYD